MSLNVMCYLMPVPGYDPEDVDGALKSLLQEDEIEQRLSESDLRAYRDGNEDLIDLLDGDEIRRILERKDASTDATE
jgi:hypothetical protein